MPYERPFRLRVLDALTAALETITVANGYKHEMATSVFRGRLVYGDSDPIPMISILEPPLPVDQMHSPDGSAASSGGWDLLIQGFVEDDHANPTDPAYLLAADVRAVLAKEREKAQGRNRDILGMAGKVDDMIIGAPVVRPAEEVSSKAYFWLPLTLKVVEDADAPYA